MLAFYIVFLCAAYLFLCGLTYSWFKSAYDDAGFCDSEFSALMSCLVWPVVAVIILGTKARGGVDLDGSILTSKGRTERRRKRELDEAKHRLEVAKLIEQENTILDSQLRANAR